MGCHEEKMNPQNFLLNHYCQKGDCDLEVTCNTMHRALTYGAELQAFTCSWSSVFRSRKLLLESRLEGDTVCYFLFVYLFIKLKYHCSIIITLCIIQYNRSIPSLSLIFFCNIMLLFSRKKVKIKS